MSEWRSHANLSLFLTEKKLRLRQSMHDKWRHSNPSASGTHNELNAQINIIFYPRKESGTQYIIDERLTLTQYFFKVPTTSFNSSEKGSFWTECEWNSKYDWSESSKPEFFSDQNKLRHPILLKWRHSKRILFCCVTDILEGSVGILNNYNLCHIKTIEWKEIITGKNAKYLYVYKFKEAERDCTPCHESCERGCWGEGKENCQKFSKINCSPQCHQGRCFGSQPRECCHLFCAGGCTGPKQSDCLVSYDMFLLPSIFISWKVCR